MIIRRDKGKGGEEIDKKKEGNEGVGRKDIEFWT